MNQENATQAAQTQNATTSQDDFEAKKAKAREIVKLVNDPVEIGNRAARVHSIAFQLSKNVAIPVFVLNELNKILDTLEPLKNWTLPIPVKTDNAVPEEHLPTAVDKSINEKFPKQIELKPTAWQEEFRKRIVYPYKVSAGNPLEPYILVQPRFVEDFIRGVLADVLLDIPTGDALSETEVNNLYKKLRNKYV